MEGRDIGRMGNREPGMALSEFWETADGWIAVVCDAACLERVQGVEAEVETMSFDEVMALSDEDDVMIIGGGEIYALFLPYAKEIHRTVIHTVVEDADTYAPAIDADEFYLLTERRVEPGERDEHAMTFQHWIA